MVSQSYRLSLSLVVLFAVVGSLPGAPPEGKTRSTAVEGEQAPSEGYSLSVQSVARVVATLTRDVSYPNCQGKVWTIFAPQAPELPGQIKTETTLDPPGKPVREIGDLARPLVMARVEAGAQPISAMKIQLTYEATLRSRKLRKGQPRKVRDLSPEERRTYLADGGYFDFDQPEFHEWIQKRGLERAAREGEIHFARRVFLALKAGMQYDAPLKKEFHATAVCKSGRADCGGLSVLFASILRANAIPARTLWGRWAKSSEPGKQWFNHPYYQTHVKAEFFARGVGWVPVDVSSAILHDKSPQGLKYFGNDPGDFVTFHVDGNLTVDTLLFGVKPLGNMQTTRWWIRGSGTLQDEKVTEAWDVTRTKLKP
jgi:transglutaminase-like putative cysteine protease